MYKDGMLDEDQFNTAVKSISFSTLLPDELKLLKQAKELSLSDKRALLKDLLDNNSKSALNPAEVLSLNNAINSESKDLKELEDMSEVLQLKEKGIKNDDPEMLSLYQSIVTKIDS